MVWRHLVFDVYKYARPSDELSAAGHTCAVTLYSQHRLYIMVTAEQSGGIAALW